MTTEKTLHTEHIGEEGRPSAYGKDALPYPPRRESSSTKQRRKAFSPAQDSQKERRGEGGTGTPSCTDISRKRRSQKRCPVSCRHDRISRVLSTGIIRDSRYNALIPAGTAFHDSPEPKNRRRLRTYACRRRRNGSRSQLLRASIGPL